MTATIAMLATLALFATACKSDKPAAPAAASGSVASGAAVAPAPAPDAAVAAGPTPEAIRALQKETIAGLTLGMTEAEVTAVLGKPADTVKLDPSDGLELRWSWPGLEVTFGSTSSGGRVARIVAIVTPSKAKTARGIGRGATRAEVKKAYAEVTDPQYANDPRFFVAGVEREAGIEGLMFLFEGRRSESDDQAPTDKVSAIIAHLRD